MAAPPTDAIAPPLSGGATTVSLAYIGIGANLGNAAAAITDALQALADLPHTTLLQRSSVYRSAPVGTDGPDYLNAVAEISTALMPLELLAALQSLETAAGRTRPWRWAPRTLDLDLLLYGDDRIDLPTLTVPHPRMWQRAFVVLPLSEIAPTRVPHGALSAVADQRISRC